MKQLIGWNIYKSVHYEESPEDIDPLIGRLIDDWMIGLVDTEGSPEEAEVSNMQIHWLIEGLIYWLISDWQGWHWGEPGRGRGVQYADSLIGWLIDLLID